MRIHPRVVTPAFRTSRRIERGDDARGRYHVHRPVYDDRCDLELRRPVRHARHIGYAGVIRPCHGQVRDIVARDLRQGRKPGAAGVVAIDGPVTGSRSLRTKDEQ